MTARGAPSKQGKDMVLAEKIRDLIAEKKQPYAVFRHSRTLHAPAKQESAKRRYTITLPTVQFPEISIANLSNKGKKYNGNKRKPKFSRIGCAIRSISSRPKYINNRSEVGHWKWYREKLRILDSKCALTLAERKTRAEIIRKIPNAKSPFGRCRTSYDF